MSKVTWQRAPLLAVFVSFLSSLLLTPHLFAQRDVGSISGTVTDPSNAVFPNAKVQATGETTGYVYATVTDADGEYTLPGLNPGVYTVTITATSGFKKFQTTGIIVYAEQIRRLDVKLEVGATTQTITVKEAAAVLQTDTATTTYRIGMREIYALNLSNNQVYQMNDSPGVDVVNRSQVHGNFANNSSAEM